MDFASSEAEAVALGEANHCLMNAQEGWYPQEYCGQYEPGTCTDVTWGAAYSQCCPAFCGTCPDDTSSEPEPTAEPTGTPKPIERAQEVASSCTETSLVVY